MISKRKKNLAARDTGWVMLLPANRPATLCSARRVSSPARIQVGLRQKADTAMHTIPGQVSQISKYEAFSRPLVSGLCARCLRFTRSRASILYTDPTREINQDEPAFHARILTYIYTRHIIYAYLRTLYIHTRTLAHSRTRSSGVFTRTCVYTHLLYIHTRVYTLYTLYTLAVI